MEPSIDTQQDMNDHFSRVATLYNDLRTTDSEPIAFIRDRWDGAHNIEAADIGCGAGRYCLTLFQHLDILHLTCLDVNESMLEQASNCLRTAGITNFKTIKSTCRGCPTGG